MDYEAAIKDLMLVIRKLRENHTPKQSQFALDAGIGPKHYSDLECNGRGLTMTTFLKICYTLRVSPWRIMYMAWHKRCNFKEQDRKKRKGN